MSSPNISFDVIQSSIRKPGQYFEFNTKLAVRTLPANAQKVKERIRALNLPVATSRLKRGGKELELIFSGPFDAKGADCALELLRGKGFPEAKLR